MERTQIESYEKATASAKAEYDHILYQVAKTRAEFELLKNVILNHLELDYSGDRLMLKNDELLIETMETIEPDQMMSILAFKKNEKEEKIRKAMELKDKKEDDNG